MSTATATLAATVSVRIVARLPVGAQTSSALAGAGHSSIASTLSAGTSSSISAHANTPIGAALAKPAAFVGHMQGQTGTFLTTGCTITATGHATQPPQSSIVPAFVQKSLYLMSTGQIVGSVQGNNAGVSGANANAGIAEVLGLYDPDTTYVFIPQGTNAGQPAPATRPAMGITVNKTTISANGTDTATFSGVPSGVAVTVDSGTPQTITDGTLALSATTVGTYTVAFTDFPMIPMTFEIVAQ